MTPDLLQLAIYRADFPNAFAQFDDWQRDAINKRQRWKLEKPPLSIGIMGQVKAGKSTFVNALLFGGKPLLPEAATPKTANLTRIRHGATARFVAHLYTPQEWAQLERLADSHAEDDTARAARELVEHTLAHGLAVAPLLAQGAVTVETDGIAALLGCINDYVGSDGHFTPLVKSCELFLPLPELEGIEIVDTPGMNDPIVSRTDKTREYMAQCDVVFFLSRACQFFDLSDQELLAQQLPQKGVKRLFLVASQFDSLLLDDGYHRASLTECETRVRDKLTQRAQENLEALIAARKRAGQEHAAALLAAVRTPIFISSYAHAFVTMSPEHWTASQRHTHTQFNELAHKHWRGQTPTADDWRRIAGIDDIAAPYRRAREEKEAILSEQRANSERELQERWNAILDGLRAQAQERVHLLQTIDVAQIEARAYEGQQRIDAISAALAEALAQITTTARQRRQEVVEDLSDAARRVTNVETRTDYKTSSHSVKVGGPVWYNPLTWLSEAHYESYRETAAYQYLAVADAIEGLRFYTLTAERQLRETFDELAPERVSLVLRKALVNAIDFQKGQIDPRALRALIEGAIATLQLPQLRFDAPDPSALVSGLPDKITSSSEMAALRTRLQEIVSNINRDLATQIEQGVDAACRQLDEIAIKLNITLTKHLNESIAQLRAALADKERIITHLNGLLALCEPLSRAGADIAQKELP